MYVLTAATRLANASQWAKSFFNRVINLFTISHSGCLTEMRKVYKLSSIVSNSLKILFLIQQKGRHKTSSKTLPSRPRASSTAPPGTPHGWDEKLFIL
jgi:hypothetical protein